MEQPKVYDLIVIGGGPAGYVAAIRASQLGLKTACIEMNKSLGGTCLNVGCIPSKALLDSSEHYHTADKKFKKHGIDVSGLSLNLKQMMKRKDDIVSQLTKGIAGLFKKNKIHWIEGKGKLLDVSGDVKQVEVTHGDDVSTLKSARILLATGSAVSELPFLKFDGKHIISSTEALKLSEVPKHLIVIGGGAIGLEMGSVWRRLGAEVSVIEYMDRLVPTMDRQVTTELQKSLKRQGMKIYTSHKCLGAKGSDTGVSVEIEALDGGDKKTLEGDTVLVATGRHPYTEGLGLEAAGIEVNDRGQVQIDAKFQTKVKKVYAVGDIVAGPMLAHKAEDEGMAAVEIMAGQASHVNYDVIPGIVYTWPEVAAVGKTEEELKEAETAFKVGTFPFMANGRAKAMDETEGLVKIIAHAHTDRVLGVHIVGPRASDMIAEAVAIMEFGGSAEDIARSCHAHPTLSEAVKEAALDVAKRRIHM